MRGEIAWFSQREQTLTATTTISNVPVVQVGVRATHLPARHTHHGIAIDSVASHPASRRCRPPRIAAYLLWMSELDATLQSMVAALREKIVPTLVVTFLLLFYRLF